MALRKVSLVVVIPVGPGCVFAHVLDTVESVLTYTPPDRRIILVDDSNKGTGQAVAARVPAVEVLVTPGGQGKSGGLYLSLCRGYVHALRHSHFDVLLRLDTDALLVGAGIERAAGALFRSKPQTAMGGEVYVDNVSVRARLEDAASPQATRRRLALLLKRPFSRYRLRSLVTERTLGRLYARALARGYRSVDYVFGGSYVMSEAFLRALHGQGLLPHPHFGPLDLEEDHIFGLLAAVVGMDLADMHTNAGPFGTAWKSLPASPADLLAQGKTVVHSTRRWQHMDEDAIRAFFRARRPGASTPPFG